MGVTYIAQKRLRVGEGFREPGEAVPEAASWMNVQSYVNRGMLAVVPDEGSPNLEPRSQKGLRDAGEGAIAPRHRLVPKRFVSTEDAEELAEDNTRDELYERAQELDIEGRSTMGKEELSVAVAEAEAERETTDPEDDEDSEESDESEFDYTSLSVAQVKQAIEDGLLTIDEVDEYEDQREGGRRKGVDEFLDSLEEDESDEE